LRVQDALEKLAVVMALKSLERCEVALLVLDASEGVSAQDAHLAGHAHAAGRAIVIVVNKWALVPSGLVRKAEVVAAVRGGLLSLEEACERYKLTVDEFLSWQRSIDKHGLPGLRATRIQDYRS